MWSRILAKDEIKPEGVVPSITSDRIKSFIIDWFLATVAGMPLLWFGAEVLHLSAAPFGILYVFSSFVVPGIYFSAFWVLTGATPGKRLMKMRLVSASQSQKLGLVAALVRYAGYYLLAISLIRYLINSDLPHLHDEMANTKVVYDY